MPDPPPDVRSDAIARHVAGFVADGATLQTGLGKLPGAILRALTDRRGLRLHTGLIGDAVLDLLAAVVVADGRDIVTGVALGTPRLYATRCRELISFRPVSSPRPAYPRRDPESRHYQRRHVRRPLRSGLCQVAVG
ncbi:hypothetical protein AB5I41_08445 [Sphingomonas sp. MMS24-JH45]